MDNKIFIFLGLLFASIIVLAAAIELPLAIFPYFAKLVLLMVAMFFVVLAFASRYYSYLIIPMVKQRSKHIMLDKENTYWLSASADSIIRKVKDTFIATVYVTIPIYRSATEMQPEEKLEFANQVSRLVGIRKDPVRYSTQMYVMDKDAYLQTIRDNVNAAENAAEELSQKGAPAAETERAKGKIAMWRNMLDTISKGTSFELVTYASISATGTKEHEAVSAVQQKARDVISGVSTTFGVTPTIVTGEEILKFVEPEHMIPVTTISAQINKNIEEEVI